MEIQIIASSSRGNCCYVNDGKTGLLVDAGIRQADVWRAMKFRVLQRVNGLLLTHEHKDHSLSAARLMTEGIDCYTSKGTAEALGLKGYRLHIIEAEREFKIETWSILPFWTTHDAAEPLGFMLASTEGAGAKILFATDTSSFADYKFGEGITEILVECNYQEEYLEEVQPRAKQERLITSHLSLETLCSFLKTLDCSKLRCIWLLHISRENADRKSMRRQVEEIAKCRVHIIGD